MYMYVLSGGSQVWVATISFNYGVDTHVCFLFFFCRREDILAPESGHGRKVFALKFHPFDDNIFLTGGWDRCIKVQANVALVKVKSEVPILNEQPGLYLVPVLTCRIWNMKRLWALCLFLDGYLRSLCLHFELAYTALWNLLAIQILFTGLERGNCFIKLVG